MATTAPTRPLPINTRNKLKPNSTQFDNLIFLDQAPPQYNKLHNPKPFLHLTFHFNISLLSHVLECLGKGITLLAQQAELG